MKRLKNIVNNNETLGGKIFDWAIQAFIIISLITFSVETLSNLSLESKAALRTVELVTVIVFSVEYFLRILCSESKPRFIFSFYGIIDLAAILPFYLTTGIDLRSIRALRLMKLSQHSKS